MRRVLGNNNSVVASSGEEVGGAGGRGGAQEVMERIRQWERQSSIYKPEIDALGWAVENKTGREREKRG